MCQFKKNASKTILSCCQRPQNMLTMLSPNTSLPLKYNVSQDLECALMNCRLYLPIKVAIEDILKSEHTKCTMELGLCVTMSGFELCDFSN